MWLIFDFSPFILALEVAGISRIRLEARQDNVHALAFYRKHGYYEHATVSGTYRGMEAGVRLEKVIAHASERLRDA